MASVYVKVTFLNRRQATRIINLITTPIRVARRLGFPAKIANVFLEFVIRKVVKVKVGG